ncbi:hypothetical protein JW921_01415, partial [Candidatus Fermentibacterales bacterium]|nr:hypothetical protein [Candidatus Fermentibacterales bacterium]
MRHVLVTLASLCLVGSGLADQLVLSCDLDAGTLRHSSGSYGDFFSMTGAANVASPGDPLLPLMPVYVALPRDAVVDGVAVTSVCERSLPGFFDIQPAQMGVPLSRPEDFVYTPPDASGFAGDTDEIYPLLSFSGQGRLMGYCVGDFALRPLAWDPTTGVVRLRERVEFVVRYHIEPGSASAALPLARSAHAEELSMELLRRTVVNPGDVGPSGATIAPSRDLPWGEYLIITSEALESAFEPLAEYKTTKGVPAAIVTVEYINANYSGVDEAQRIRHFLRAIYDDTPPTYVLIGGDVDQVDARNCWATAEGYVGDPAADLYYQDMNDTAPGADCWDHDNDGTWGEIPDDIMDYHPD